MSSKPKGISNNIDNLYIKYKYPKTLSKFIEDFLISHVHGTYLDPECTKPQRTGGGWRSINDIYVLVNTYFPNTSLKSILEVLIKLKVYFGYCSTIRRKIVYYQPTGYTRFWLDNGYRDLYYSSSWKNLFKENGITEEIFNNARKSL